MNDYSILLGVFASRLTLIFCNFREITCSPDSLLNPGTSDMCGRYTDGQSKKKNKSNFLKLEVIWMEGKKNRKTEKKKKRFIL